MLEFSLLRHQDLPTMSTISHQKLNLYISISVRGCSQKAEIRTWEVTRNEDASLR